MSAFRERDKSYDEKWETTRLVPPFDFVPMWGSMDDSGDCCGFIVTTGRPAYRWPSLTVHDGGAHGRLVSDSEVAVLTGAFMARALPFSATVKIVFIGWEAGAKALASQAQETFHACQNDMKRSDETLTVRHVSDEPFLHFLAQPEAQLPAGRATLGGPGAGSVFHAHGGLQTLGPFFFSTDSCVGLAHRVLKVPK